MYLEDFSKSVAILLKSQLQLTSESDRNPAEALQQYRRRTSLLLSVLTQNKQKAIFYEQNWECQMKQSSVIKTVLNKMAAKWIL